MNITPKNIKSSIDEATPFKRGQIAEDYSNIPIEWDVTFSSIYKVNDKSYKLTLLDSDNSYPWIYCDNVDIDKYHQFKFMREKEKFSVKGKIDKVTGAHSILLKDCEFIFDYKDKTLNSGKDNRKSITDNPIININNSQVHLGKRDNVGNNKIKNKLSNKAWFEKPIGIIALAVIAGIIIGAILYFLNWN